MGDFSFTDEALRQSALLITDAMLEAVPSAAESTHEFTASFETRMKKLLLKAKQKKPLRTLQHIAAIFLAVLLSATTFLAVNTEARAAFARWTLEVFGDNVIYRYFGAPTDATIPNYRLGGLSSEYEVIDVLGDKSTKVIIYSMGENELLLFHYHRITTDRSFIIESMGEEMTREVVDINGISGDYYAYPNGSYANTLVWLDDENGLVFSIEAFSDRDTILSFAKSVEVGNVLLPFPEYTLTWVPEGYAKTGERASMQSRTYDYSHNEKEISFEFSATEGTTLTDACGIAPADADALLEIDNREAFFIAGDDGENHLYWLDTDNGITFQLSASESLDIMECIAERATLVK